jgi:hypothetical protein
VRDFAVQSVTFRKSSYSAAIGQCVEVGSRSPQQVIVRDSQDADGLWVAVSAAGWREFTSRVKAE